MKKKLIVIGSISLVFISLSIILMIWIDYQEDLNHIRTVNIFKMYTIPTERKTGGVIWLIINNEETMKHIERKFSIVFPSIDFTQYALLWSDGRKISKIEYKKKLGHYSVPIGYAEFMGEYQPHTAFVYEIERIDIKQDDEYFSNDPPWEHEAPMGSELK